LFAFNNDTTKNIIQNSGSFTKFFSDNQFDYIDSTQYIDLT
jgi:hypothetical protein